jgi:hypothetical protein
MASYLVMVLSPALERVRETFPALALPGVRKEYRQE